MNWFVLIKPEAERDLEQARDYFNSKKQGLGLEFLDEFSNVLSIIESNPFRHPVSYREFRRSLIRRFRYKIFYTVEMDRIIIHRLLHFKMNHPIHL